MRKITQILAPLLLICSLAHAATISGPLTQAEVNAAAGGTLNVSAGTFTATSPITVPSGTAIIGALGFGSHFVFTGASPSAAFIIAGNASNVTISGLDVHSNNGVAKLMDGSAYIAIHFTHDNFQYAGGGAFGSQAVEGVTDTVPCGDFEVTNCYFHDSQNSDRAGYFFGSTAARFNNNLFYSVNAGFQFNAPGANCQFNDNYATLLHAKLLETGMQNAPGFQAIGNVAYDWTKPDKNSMFLSICETGNGIVKSNQAITITGNYGRLNPVNGVWGTDGVVSGVVYEISGYPCNFSNNIGGATAAPGIVSVCSIGATGSGNSLFGPTQWGAISGEPVYGGGEGSWLGAAPAYNASLAAMPTPPANTFAGPTVSGATPVITGVTPATTEATPATTLTVTAVPTDNGVTLAWSQQLTGISIHTYTPSDDCGTLTEAGPASGVMLSTLNAGWGYECDVTGTLNGATVKGTVKFTTAGQSPNGTKATIAAFAKQIAKTVTTVTYTNDVVGSSSVETYYTDGTQSP